VSGAWDERKTERSEPKIGWSCERAWQKTMERERRAEREVAERKRNGERAESACHSLLRRYSGPYCRSVASQNRVERRCRKTMERSRARSARSRSGNGEGRGGHINKFERAASFCRSRSAHMLWLFVITLTNFLVLFLARCSWLYYSRQQSSRGH